LGFGKLMLWRHDHHQLIAVNGDQSEAVVIDGQGDDTEIHRIINDILKNFDPFGAADVDRYPGILLFKFGKDLGQDMQTGSFIGADDELATRDALHFGEVDDHLLAGVDGLLGVILKSLAGGGEADLASGTVEELGPNLIFEGTDLGGDGRLRAETLFRGAGEAAMARNFEKRFYLVKIHKKVASFQIAGCQLPG